MDLELGTRLRLGVSRCLLGEAVRYDGGDKRDHWVADRFGPMVEWVRVCPEEEAGLGVPRPKIRLESADGSIRVREVESSIDHTEHLQSWADQRLPELGDLDGYVFKSRSPSCGVEGVEVFVEDHPVGRAPGFFVERLLELDPYLPTCTEVDVQVPELRRHFLERAQTRARWRRHRASGNDRASFLERHELLLVCRGQAPIDTDGVDDDPLQRRLRERMHEAPTLDGHVTALARLYDDLDAVTAHERVGLGVLIDQVQREETDVEVARQFARGLVLRAGSTWARSQHYLDPMI